MKKLIFSILFLTGLVATAQVDRTKQPTPGPAPEINIKDPKSFDLKNGLKVIVVEDHKLPRVIYSLQTDNPPVKEGDAIGAAAQGAYEGAIADGASPQEAFEAAGDAAQEVATEMGIPPADFQDGIAVIE